MSENTRLKVMFVSTCFAEDWIVIRQLLQLLDKIELVIVRPTDKSTSGSGWWKNWRDQSIQRAITQAEFNGSFPETRSLKNEHGVAYIEMAINNPMFSELLKCEKPRYVITCGAPILKAPVLKTMKNLGIVCANLHWGIHYRGAESSFWALYHRDLENVGVTLHLIDQGVDTGAHLARCRPEVCCCDDEVTLWRKNGNVAASLVTELLCANPESISGVAPQGKGPCFRYGDRTMYCDMVEFFRRSWARFFSPSENIPEKREVFYSSTPKQEVKEAAVA